MEGSWECGNESSGSLKCWEGLEQMHSWLLLKNGSASRDDVDDDDDDD
jgi:hypothetical protein